MRNLLIIICFAAFSVKAQQNPNTVKPLVIGEIHTVASKSLQEDRTLNIYLPPKYDSSKSYPVMYVLDGSMDEDFLHIVGLVQFFNMSFKMPEVIVVGVSNIDRQRDFTFPTEIADLRKDYPTTGHSANFIRFIADELQPYINSKFKTNGTNYIIGQSLGGLLAIEVMLTQPLLFTHYLVVSPSLWWDNQSLLQKIPGAAKNTDKLYVALAVGQGEHPITIRDAENFRDLLKKASPETTVEYLLMKDEDHATILHNSVYQMFLKLFKIPAEH